MDKIIKDIEVLEELENKNRDGKLINELIEKLNEIVDWINNQ